MTSEKESITQDLIPNLIKSRVGGAQKLRRTKLIRIVGVGLLVSRAAYDLIFSVLFFFFFFSLPTEIKNWKERIASDRFRVRDHR